MTSVSDLLLCLLLLALLFRYAYLLPSCPRGCRRAVVLLRGRGAGAATTAAGGIASAAAGGNVSSASGASGPACTSSGGSAGSGRSASSGSGTTEAGVAAGVQFACARLCFIRRDEVESFGADACLEGWAGRVVQGL